MEKYENWMVERWYEIKIEYFIVGYYLFKILVWLF